VPQKMGFWETHNQEEILQYEGISPSDYYLVLHYMCAAKPIDHYFGRACCRICGVKLGCADMLTPDGKWIFPEKWQHYVIVHKLHPTEVAFISDAHTWTALCAQQKVGG